jgi:hypothetical protein
VKDQWHEVFRNPQVMRDYQYFCLYYPRQLTYKLIIFGVECPLSKCCKQLIVFHFSHNPHKPADSAILQVYCCDPGCSETPLFEKVINSKQFVESIMRTSNGPQIPLLVASTSPLGIT